MLIIFKQIYLSHRCDLTYTISPSQSGPGSNSNEGVLHIELDPHCWMPFSVISRTPLFGGILHQLGPPLLQRHPVDSRPLSTGLKYFKACRQDIVAIFEIPRYLLGWIWRSSISYCTRKYLIPPTTLCAGGGDIWFSDWSKVLYSDQKTQFRFLCLMAYQPSWIIEYCCRWLTYHQNNGLTQREY